MVPVPGEDPPRQGPGRLARRILPIRGAEASRQLGAARPGRDMADHEQFLARTVAGAPDATVNRTRRRGERHSYALGGMGIRGVPCSRGSAVESSLSSARPVGLSTYSTSLPVQLRQRRVRPSCSSSSCGNCSAPESVPGRPARAPRWLPSTGSGASCRARGGTRTCPNARIGRQARDLEPAA